MGIIPSLNESEQIIYFAFGKRNGVDIRKVEDMITSDKSSLKLYLETIEIKNQENFKSPKQYLKTTSDISDAFMKNIKRLQSERGSLN